MLTRYLRDRKEDGKLAILRRLPRLAVLSEAELLRLAAIGELIEVPAGATLTREGQPAREAFLIVEGHLRVTRRELTVTSLWPGDFAGEVALLDHQPRATGVEAVTDAEVLAFSRSALQQLVHTSPWFVDHLLGQLALRVRCGVPT